MASVVSVSTVLFIAPVFIVGVREYVRLFLLRCVTQEFLIFIAFSPHRHTPSFPLSVFSLSLYLLSVYLVFHAFFVNPFCS